MSPTRRDLGAAVVLAAHVFLFVMAPPITDYLAAEPKRAWGPFVQLQELDARVREPLVAPLKPVEELLGARQYWSFYSTGASSTRHLEVWVDGELWHRSNDPDHAFMAAPLANSRLRHHSKDWVRGKRITRVQDPLLRLVTARVLAERPQAKRVELRGLEGRIPGEHQDVVRAAYAEAPDWAVQRGTP